MTALTVPAPTLSEGAPFILLWAEFTGRAPIDRHAAPAVEGPSGRYMAEHL